MKAGKVLVVGTTSDYIDIISQTEKERVVFLTDTSVREKAVEVSPPTEMEFTEDLTDFRKVINGVKSHSRKYHYHIDGIACFDCETMELAAMTASSLDLPFPDLSSVQLSRDKHLSKEWWRSNGLDTPASEIVESESQAVDFFKRSAGKCIFKPVSGSGSEHVFKCSSIDHCTAAYRTIASKRNPAVAVAEQFVEGTEYSCDFSFKGSSVCIIRLTRKIKFADGIFGTINGYELIDGLPGNISQGYFDSILTKAAGIFGKTNSICMIDFIVRGNRIFILEIAPRPGGDCLPWLVKNASGLDILSMTIDQASGEKIRRLKPKVTDRVVGLKIHAKEPGVLKRIDAEKIRYDSRVREIYFKWREGHRVALPPHDYDSWVLGHIVFKPSGFVDLEHQCRELLSRVTIEMEKPYDIRSFGVHGAVKSRTGNKNFAA